MRLIDQINSRLRTIWMRRKRNPSVTQRPRKGYTTAHSLVVAFIEDGRRLMAIHARTNNAAQRTMRPYMAEPRSGRLRRSGTGLYPHSSTRQRARYARQLAANQINF